MTSYQRIAALVLRLTGIVWTTFFVFGWSVYLIEMALGVEVQRYPMHTIIGNVAYIVLGFLVTAFSKPLGRLIVRGLEP